MLLIPTFFIVLLLGQIYYFCEFFLLLTIFYVFLDILAYGFFYYWKKLKLFIWHKSFYKNYYFIVFGIFVAFLLLFVFDFYVFFTFDTFATGLGVIEESLYFFWLSLPGDLEGDVWFDRCVNDDLYLIGKSILKLIT